MWQGGKEATQRGGGIPRLRNATSRQAGRKKRHRVAPLEMTSGGLFPGEKASRSSARNDKFGLLAGEAVEVGHLALHLVAGGVGGGADALDAQLEFVGIGGAQQGF